MRGWAFDGTLNCLNILEKEVYGTNASVCEYCNIKMGTKNARRLVCVNFDPILGLRFPRKLVHSFLSVPCCADV